MARILFLQNIDYEFLGPMYISSMVKKHGHQCELQTGDHVNDFDDKIGSFKPDFVAFSIMSGSHDWALEMARQVKKRYNIKNIFGGAHPTFFPDFVQETGVDYLIRGEGEEAVVEILDRFSRGEDFDGVSNLSFMRNGKAVHNPLRSLRQNPDEYPFPDRALYKADDRLPDRYVKNVITSRGCPFHCSFCFEDAMRELYKGKGKYVRIREIDSVIDECRQLISATSVKTIYFADDVFGMKKEWLYDFLEVYKREINLPFICLVRADIVASDDVYAKKLFEAGCRSVFFGVESGNEKLRNDVLVKQLSNDQILRAAHLLHEAGIKFRTYNIVGLPDETLEDAFSTVEMNIKIKADYPWCSIFSPFPGTALTDYAFAKGYLSPTFEYAQISKSFFLDSPLNIPNAREKQNLQKFFQTAVLWPWTFGLVKQLIKLPPNFLFKAWFGVVYFYVFVKSEQRAVLSTLRFAIKNYRHVLAKE
jgi:anaerobic magnesium-protoporphyrin IX monomethyl ester cyclase